MGDIEIAFLLEIAEIARAKHKNTFDFCDTFDYYKNNYNDRVTFYFNNFWVCNMWIKENYLNIAGDHYRGHELIAIDMNDPNSIEHASRWVINVINKWLR